MDAALKITEIRMQIAKHLIQEDLLQCTLVCQQWAADFRRPLWREVDLTQRESHTMTKALFQKYAHLIRNLNIRDPMPLLQDWLVSPYCNNLLELSINPRLSRKRDALAASLRGKVPSLKFDQDMTFLSVTSVDKAIELIDCNSNLQTVMEQWFTLSPAHANLFMERLCRHHTTITHLQTSYWEISSLDDLRALLKHSPQLRKLHLFQPTFYLTRNDDENTDEDAAAPATTAVITEPLVLDFGDIQDLSLMAAKLVTSSSSSSSDYPLTVHAAEMTTLALMGFQGTTLIEYKESHPLSLARRVTTWRCPKVTTLTLSQDDFDAVYNANALFASADGLQHLEMSGCRLDSALLRSLLEKHALTLRSVNFSWSTGLSSTDLQLILTSCPNLLSFQGSGDRLLGSELIETPWVCRRLEMLVMFLDIPPLEDNQEGDAMSGKRSTSVAERNELFRAIYDQLARLEHLRMIRLGGMCRLQKVRTGIPWTLEAGLDRLRGLSRIETIYVTENVAEIGMGEVEWFQRYWPRLKTIRRLDDLTNMMEAHAAAALGTGVEVF